MKSQPVREGEGWVWRVGEEGELTMCFYMHILCGGHSLEYIYYVVSIH